MGEPHTHPFARFSRTLPSPPRASALATRGPGQVHLTGGQTARAVAPRSTGDLDRFPTGGRFAAARLRISWSGTSYRQGCCAGLFLSFQSRPATPSLVWDSVAATRPVASAMLI
jgi:hypothetical protein